MTSFHETELPGVVEILPDRHGDHRGFFSETWNEQVWRSNGIDCSFVQDNHSLSEKAGILRGLHFQLPPFEQAKLVRVTSGSVFDVAVDIRKGSPYFGKWVGVELSARKWNQLFIPAGFAHGFLTLEPGTEFLYKVSSRYSAEHERSIRYDDPELAIHWPLRAIDLILSEKDGKAGNLADCEIPFEYREE